MKQNLLLKSMSGLAMVILMTSCVAKKKYTEAQNQISQLQTENARLTETGTTMQQNVTSLETNNRTLQTRLDSTNTWVTGQQTRWNSFQAFYDEGTKTTEQVHQQLHEQMDAVIGAENITTSGGRVTVTLAEKTLFSSGSSKLSAKGQEVLTQLAQIVKDNPNVEIDIASAPGYYTAGSMNSSNNTSMSNTSMSNSATTTTDATVKTDADGDVKYKDGDTKVKMDADGDVKIKSSGNKSVSTSKKSSSYSGTAKKSTTHKSTARKSESSAKSRTYSSSPARKAATSASAAWSLNMARSGAIAKKLVEEGVAKSRILVNNDNTTTPASTTKDYQIIISPKADTYYNSLGTPAGTTNQQR